jgi:large subunit ribosomal protein L22
MAEHRDVKAVGRFIPVSTRKTRLVVDMIRGRSANEAMDVLRFTHNAGSDPVAKVLRSAIANAEQNFGLSRDDLFVSAASADEGPTRRWRRFGARGRFKPIQKGSSHITIVLRERTQVGS